VEDNAARLTDATEVAVAYYEYIANYVQRRNFLLMCFLRMKFLYSAALDNTHCGCFAINYSGYTQ